MQNNGSTVVDVLAELDVRRDDRVLIMLPDGPGFTESFTATFERGALPLPVSPQLSARDLTATATYANARLVLACRDRLPALAGLDAEPPILVSGPDGLRAAALRLRN
ncbi:MAG TPA: AMP-binding protein [Pseudonocardiaceae bacterium]|nr:AMP-binding protein [Pseudonocardiaceae bacterium]